MEKEIIEGKTAALSARISWHVEANIECPHCGHYNEFMDMDDWWTWCNVGENKDFDDPIETECLGCGKEFLVNGCDY